MKWFSLYGVINIWGRMVVGPSIHARLIDCPSYLPTYLLHTSSNLLDNYIQERRHRYACCSFVFIFLFYLHFVPGKFQTKKISFMFRPYMRAVCMNLIQLLQESE